MFIRNLLGNSYHSDDDQLALPVYNVIMSWQPKQYKKRRSLHLWQKKFTSKGNCCLYSKWVFSLLAFYWKPFCLHSTYRTPSQTSNEYDISLVNFEQLLTYLNSLKPHVLLVVTDDFNARSLSWWFDDTDTIKRRWLETITLTIDFIIS